MAYPARILIIVAVCAGETSGIAQITQQQVIEAIRAEKLPALAHAINSMPAELREKSAEEVARLVNQEFASGKEYHDGKTLISILPDIADDALLAETLSPYLSNADRAVRSTACTALSRGKGPAVGDVLSRTIVAAFASLPSLPIQPVDDAAARDVNTNAEIFLECLKGLLNSESQSARRIGIKYFGLLHQRYSKSAEGQIILTAFEEQLASDGVAVESITEEALSSAGTLGAQGTQTPMNVPTSTASELGYVSPPRKMRTWEWTIVGVAVLLAVVAVILKRRL